MGGAREGRSILGQGCSARCNAIESNSHNIFSTGADLCSLDIVIILGISRSPSEAHKLHLSFPKLFSVPVTFKRDVY